MRQLLKCSKCGMAVVKDGETIVRACSCEGAALVAEVKATVKGNGGVR